MRVLKLTLLFFFINISIGFAQIFPGAKEIAMGNSSVAQSDNAMALFVNPAGSAQLSWKEMSVYYAPSLFGMKELATAYAAALFPFRFGVLSGGFSTYGFDLFRETTLSLSFSKVFLKRMLIGIAIDYKHIQIKNYGNSGSLLFDVGGIFLIIPQVKFGFAIKNLTNSTYENYENQIPTIFSVGISAQPIDVVTLNISLSKDLEYPLSARFGLEYGIFRNIDLRCGFRTKPNAYSGGIGVKYKFFELDYAIFTHEELNLSHQLSLIIALHDITERNKLILKSFGIK